MVSGKIFDDCSGTTRTATILFAKTTDVHIGTGWNGQCLPVFKEFFAKHLSVCKQPINEIDADHLTIICAMSTVYI